MGERGEMNTPGRFWTGERVGRLSRVLLVVAAIALGAACFLPATRESAVLNLGDYPAFHVAAEIVAMGEGDRLYDWRWQMELQEGYSSNAMEAFCPFAYPPPVALLLRPLAAVPLMVGKWIFVSLMLLCLLGAIRVSARSIPMLRSRTIETVAVFAVFLPGSMGLIGAQNTPVGMLLLALAWDALARGTRGGDFACGVWLGLWLFKPQYPLILVACLIVARRWAVVGGFSAVACAYYAIGCLVMDWSWPLTWAAAVFDFAAIDALFENNFPVSIQGSGLLQWLAGVWGGAGGPGEAISYVTYSIAGAVFLWLLWKFAAVPRGDRAAGPGRLLAWFDVAVPAMLLVSPHSHFYDCGLCLFPVARRLRFPDDRSVWWALGALLGVDVLTLLRPLFPFQPLVVIPLGAMMVLLWRIDPSPWPLARASRQR